MATITNTNDGTIGNTVLLRQYVTDVIPMAQTISGTFRGQMRCIESIGSANMTVAVSVRACSGDGTTIRSPALLAISASDSSSAPFEMVTSLTNRPFLNSAEVSELAVSACTISAGDRLIFEVGFRNGSTTAARTGGVSCGDNSASDLPVGDTTVTAADNPWVEFEQNLFVPAGIQFLYE